MLVSKVSSPEIIKIRQQVYKVGAGPKYGSTIIVITWVNLSHRLRMTSEFLSFLSPTVLS
jgi:hypothetical protein